MKICHFLQLHTLLLLQYLLSLCPYHSWLGWWIGVADGVFIHFLQCREYILNSENSCITGMESMNISQNAS